MRMIPKEWLDGNADRLILHWTAGAYGASANDKAHYHFLADGSGKPVRGDWDVSDNHYTGDGRYAAHTYSLNTRSIGLSACCMAGAVEGGNHGSYPMTEGIYKDMIRMAADLCEHYGLDPDNRRQVLTHAEVTSVYGKDQGGKWDIAELSFARGLSSRDVFAKIRADIIAELKRPSETVGVYVDGAKVDDGMIVNGRTYVPARAVAEALGAKVSWDGSERRVDITSP